MVNLEKLRAKTLLYRYLNNPGLKSGVVDNEILVDFSPEDTFILNTTNALLSTNFQHIFQS
jgi:hypothetical protein